MSFVLFGNQVLKGIKESDETFFLESDKRIKFISHRKRRKHGGVAIREEFLKNKYRNV